MQLEFINGIIQNVVEYLPKLQLKGRENRARQKLLKKVTEKFQELYSDFQEIKSEHPDDMSKQNEELKTLLQEQVTIDMTEYAHLMSPLYDALMDYPHEIDTERETNLDANGNQIASRPSDATIHDYIIDVLEAAVEVDDSDNESQIDGVEDAQYQEVE